MSILVSLNRQQIKRNMPSQAGAISHVVSFICVYRWSVYLNSWVIFQDFVIISRYFIVYMWLWSTACWSNAVHWPLLLTCLQKWIVSNHRHALCAKIRIFWRSDVSNTVDGLVNRSFILMKCCICVKILQTRLLNEIAQSSKYHLLTYKIVYFKYLTTL